MNPEDITRFQKYIEGELEELLESKYAPYMKTYVSYRKKIGPHCLFCKQAAKHMFLEEFARNGQEFMSRFNEGNWDGYR